MKLFSLVSAHKVASDIKCHVIEADLQFANDVLTRFNSKNRPLSKSVAKLYANEMLRCKWDLTGEPIIFGIDDDGNEYLISGQHRLEAIRIANQQHEMDPSTFPDAQLSMVLTVVSGVRMDVADSVDKGKSRTHADVLFRDEWIDGRIPEGWNSTVVKRKKWCTVLAGAARLVWLRGGGATVSSAPKFLISEMLDFIRNDHPELTDFVTMVLDANDDDGGNAGLKMSLSYIAALAYIASLTVDEDSIPAVDADIKDKLDIFINNVAVGTGFDAGSPEHALTGYWNSLVSTPGTKDRDLDWVGPFVKCLNALLSDKTGVKPSSLKLTKKEASDYSKFPILLPGWDTASFELAAEAKAAAAVQPAGKGNED